MLYNHKIKVYPDGTAQHFIYFRTLERDNPQPVLSCPHRVEKSKVQDKEVDNQKRARSEVYDLCRSNVFKYFVTLTLDPKICDSYDYDESCKELYKFRHWLSKRGYKYVFVPEQHKSGRWHFHALIGGDDLPLEQAYYPDGNVIKGVYHVISYKSGYTTVSFIKDRVKVSSYICKYLTKEMSVPKGRKRYWATQNLERPLVGYEFTDDVSALMDIASRADYIKNFSSEYIEGRMYEIHGQVR